MSGGGYKLYYFPVRARGEMDRWAFAAAKIDFEDIRLNREEWLKEKESGRPPLGQMPFIVTPEGKILAQSGAILKYICKKGGLTPSDSFDEAQADMIVDGVEDLRVAMVKAHFQKDEEEKKKLWKEFFETTVPHRLGKHEALLKSRDGGKGYFFGDKLTYADIAFVEFFQSLKVNVDIQKEKEKKEHLPDIEEILKKFSLLYEYYKRVLAVEEIKTCIEKRPQSDF
ncbi:glutathione S-transferase-like isoform X1 [Porites lutea]